MKQNFFAVAALMAAVLCLSASTAQAQRCSGRGGKVKRVLSIPAKVAQAALGQTGATYDSDGRVQPQASRVNPKSSLINGARDQFTPAPIYAYSTEAMRAGKTHSWNQSQQNANSWHGGYNTWRYGQPTAVVVPPTASYQATYAWGVGQTRSTPIHHQFGRGGGSAGGNAGEYQNAPYFPSNTNQFGYYPVRSNW